MRVFAFGCSLTDYLWPTWADLIGKTAHNNGGKYYNFANSGGGNQYIVASLFMADQKYKFQSDDIILVMWSSWTREDRYIVNYHWNGAQRRGRWTKEGNILTTMADPKGNQIFDSNFLKYWSLENDIVKNIVAINSARKCFNITHEDSIPVHEPGPNEDKDRQDIGEEIYDKYIHATWNMGQDWEKIIVNSEGQTDPLKRLMDIDGHPLPSDHLRYVQECTSFELDEDTVAYALRWQGKLFRWCVNQDATKPINKDVQFEKLIDLHYRERKSYTHKIYTDLWTDDCFIDLLNGFKIV